MLDLVLSDGFLFDTRTNVAKALNPNNPRDFLVITRRLTNAVRGLAGREEAKALRRALNILDVDWADMSDDAKDRIVNAARQALRPPPQLATQISEMLKEQGQKVASSSMQSIIPKARFRGALKPTADDRAFFANIADSQAHYIRNEFGLRADSLAETARKVVSSGVKEGLPKTDIVANLQETMSAQQVARSNSYYEMVTNTYVGRTRSLANLVAMERADVSHFEFHAVLDEATSDICRLMHGKQFEVVQARSVFQRVAEAALSDPEAVTELQPWVSAGKDENGASFLYYKNRAGDRTRVADIDRSGVGEVDEIGSFSNSMSDAALRRAGIMTPPLHGNCRSTIIAV